MGGFDLVLGLVAVLALTTATPVQHENEKALAIPTSCPAIDPMDSTIHLRHEAMCSLFYKCEAGEKIVQLCPHKHNHELLYFNPELQVCDWPTNVTCASRSCVLDAMGNPVKIPYDSSCQQHYDCIDGELSLRRCPDGMKFDHNLKQCVMDADATCGPIKQQCDTIYKEPLAESCSFYVICLAAKNVVLPCPAGKFFSRSLQDCVDEHQADCKPPIMTPYPSDCSLYYHNKNGVNVLESCEEGLHFNQLSQKCEDPSNAGCTVATPTGNPPPRGHPCSGESRSPHPTECRLYLECVDGEEKVKICDEGLHFNPFAHVCQPASEAGCDDREPCPKPTPEPECSGNDKIAYPDECRMYQECVNGFIKTKPCPEGLHFNATLQTCLDPCEARCDLSWNCPPPKEDCTGNGKSPHDDCRFYQQCVDGFVETIACPDGLHFNRFEEQCQEPCQAGCDPNQICTTSTEMPTTSQPECTGNFTSPHKICYLYHECVNGVIETKLCGEGRHFNPFEKKCQEPCQAHCDPTLVCPTPTPTPEPECIGDSKLKHICDCGVYYQCVDGRKKLRLCDDGLHFNPVAQECQPPCIARCDPNQICSTETPTTIEPTTSQPKCRGNNKSPGDDCNSYIECVDGFIKVRHCEQGLHFNPFVQECQEPCEALCDPNQVCTTATPSTTEPTTSEPKCTGNNKSPGDDCNSYIECVDGFIKIRHCEQGLHFNPFVQECQEPCEALCDPNQVCTTATPSTTEPTTSQPKCRGNNKSPGDDCNSYIECVDGFIKIRHCEEGLHFNPFVQECQEPCEALCDPNQVCTTATPSTTEPTTSEPKCEGNNKSPGDDCNSYIECVDGFIKIRHCEQGLHFNPFVQECQEPCEAGCDKTLPCSTVTLPTTVTPGPAPECTGNSKAPHKCDCTKYKQCEDGKIIVKDCEEGLHFNKHAGKCQAPCEAYCDKTLNCTSPSPSPSPKPECTGNFKTAIAGNCTAYLECYNGKRRITICPDGLHFNSFSQDCQEPCDAGCDKDVICASTTDPSTLPVPEDCVANSVHPHRNCNLYYKCEDGKVKTKHCEEGQHFNPFALSCMEPCLAGCDKDLICTQTTEPSSSPVPEDCVANSVHPHKDCNLYYKCEDGKVKTKRCEEGQHFNPSSQICQHPCQAGCDPAWQCYEPTVEPICTANGRMPHESDCRLYYECKDGTMLIRTCRKGLHFNRFAQECQNPREANCSNANV